MSVSFEKAQSNVHDLIVFFQSKITADKRNEATTRLHLIDRLLFECLGWERQD
jgi:predicted type IV restriction endonuclease